MGEGRVFILFLFSIHTVSLFEFGNKNVDLFEHAHLVSEAYCASRCVIYSSNRRTRPGEKSVCNQ